MHMNWSSCQYSRNLRRYVRTYLSLGHGVADGLVPLGGDGDEHEDCSALDHALGRVPEERVAHLVPQRLKVQECDDQRALDHHVQDQQAVHNG